jgi:hypothetical protein
MFTATSLICSQTPSSEFLPEGSASTLTCSLNFVGSQSPSLIWNPGGFNITTSDFAVLHGTVSSTLAIDVPAPPGVVGPFLCSTQFSPPTVYPPMSWISKAVAISCTYTMRIWPYILWLTKLKNIKNAHCKATPSINKTQQWWTRASIT